MSNQNPRLTSAVLVINDGKYLLAERNKENYNGYWIILGEELNLGRQ